MDRNAFCRWVIAASLLGGSSHASAQKVPARFLAAMASEKFKVRESGQHELLAWARKNQAVALDAVYEDYRNSLDPEVRQRCLAVLRELITDQYLTEGAGFLGVGMDYVSLVPPGELVLAHAVLVTTVRQGTPANRAGIQAGDMIVRLDGKGWADESSPIEFSEQVASKKPGATVRLRMVRDGKWMDVEAVLVRRPANVQLLRFGIAGFDEAAEERAAIDAYFKDWLNDRSLRK